MAGVGDVFALTQRLAEIVDGTLGHLAEMGRRSVPDCFDHVVLRHHTAHLTEFLRADVEIEEPSPHCRRMLRMRLLSGALTKPI
jgi:hypothetical protein